jgi:heat-inducible transcriptional repressor
VTEPSDRQRRILIALCRQFVVGGRPVASGTLCRARGLEWSPATVRNELAVLEQLGFVHKPHAASGRVPTPEGWRVYVAELPRGAARPEHRRLVDVSLGDSADPRLGLRSTVRVLSEIAGCVAIGFVGESRPGVVRALELVPLAGSSDDSGRVLVMLGLDDGVSSVRTIDCDRELLAREGELRRVQELLRELTVDRTLEQAREHVGCLLDAQEQRVDRLVSEALRIGLMLCMMSLEPLWMQVAGHGSLPGWAGASGAASETADAVAEILALLEDYQRLAEILCQLLPEPEAEPRASVRVDLSLEQLGAAALGQPMLGVSWPGQLTLVGCRLRWPSRALSSASPASSATGVRGASMGAVALLGSPRMDYEAVIPLVQYAARAMAART